MNFSTFNSNAAAARFLRRLGVAVLALVASAAAINWLVDPYGMFVPPRIEGLNAIKPAFVEHLRLTIPYAIERLRPDGLILGTSRAGRGFSTTHPSWHGLKVYNSALPAASIYEMWRLLQHAHAVHPLQRVVLGLDHRVFYQNRDGDGTFSEARLRVDADGRRQFNLFSAQLPDLAASLLSMDALRDSLGAVRFQGWAKLTLSERGEWQSTSDDFDHANGFRAMTLNTFDRYQRYKADRFSMSKSIEPLREILRFCYREHIDLRMVIPPSHAWHLEAMRLSGMQDRWDDIKRAIVVVNAEVATEVGHNPFPVWDFSGYMGPNIEPVPVAAPSKMTWYWESVHFKQALGDRVLATILAPTIEKTEPKNSLGQLIDSQNIDRHLREWHGNQREYSKSHPDEIESIGLLHEQWRRESSPEVQ